MSIPDPGPAPAAASAWPYAAVVVNVPIERRKQAGAHRPADEETFTYAIPPELDGQVAAGQRVWVPFGRRQLQGIVVALQSRSPVERTRELAGLVDRRPVLTVEDIALARWMNAHYLAPFYACLATMLPPGGAPRLDVVYKRTGAGLDPSRLSEAQLALLGLFGRLRELEEDALVAASLAARLPAHYPELADLAPALQSLVDAELLTVQTKLIGPRVKARHEKVYRLISDDPEELATRMGALPRGVSAVQLAVLDALSEAGGTLRRSELAEATGLAAATLLRALKALEAAGLLLAGTAQVWRDLLPEPGPAGDAPPLTPDQAAAWSQVEPLLGRSLWQGGRPNASFPQIPPTILVHGVTGSGKTEVYLKAIEHVLFQGRQAIVLVPEIALTPQTLQRFAERFPGRVGVWHSELSEGQRLDTWQRARDGLLDIVVGSRSAVFAPLTRLGLIVIDEEHADAYKHPRTPRYDARAVAIRRAALAGAAVLMGSATPSLNSYWHARRGDYLLLELPRRVVRVAGPTVGDAPPRTFLEADLPLVEVVDMRSELKAGNTSLFSRALEVALGQTLRGGEQAILFLNRRGSNTFVICRDCGHVQRCPRCDIPLTFHAADGHLTCHHCNHREVPPMLCPHCGSARIRYFGTGTQKVEAAMREAFPEARLLRWDADTTGARGSHAAILDQFGRREADVLIGTQMIAKGLDLPGVTLVGIVAADTALSFPDYAASERAFQLLTQVAGRAGRSELGGRVILQTYQPEHPAIHFAATHDFAGFFRAELAFRADHAYPPFSQLARLEFRAPTARAAARAAKDVAEALRARILQLGLAATTVLGPAPSFFQRVRGRSRWQIILRSPDPQALLAGFPLGQGWAVDIEPVSLL